MYANNLDDAFSVFASGTTEEWVKSDKYMDYPEYHDEDYTYIEGRTIGDIIAQVSVQGEAYSQYISFMINRYYDGIDLIGMSIWIHYELKDGSGSEDSPVNVMYNDSNIKFGWIIPEKATQQVGEIKIGVWVNGTAPNTKAYILKTEEKIYTIHPGLIPGSGITQPDSTWFENFANQMDSKVFTAQGHANDAQASKTAAADSATESAKSATASARALEENKAYVESQKAAFAGYNRRETDLKYANALIGSATGTTQVTVSDAWEAPIPGLEIAGKSEQGADPSPDNPQEIVSTDVTAVTVTGANMSKTAAITLTEPLRGIGDVRDRIMCNDGVWCVERKLVRVSLDGKENWMDYKSKGSNSFGVSTYDNLIKMDAVLLCDDLKVDSAVGVWDGTKENTIASSKKSGGFNLRVYLNSTTTLDSLKALLAARPMTVIAERTTPTWEPLPAATQSALNALTTYTGQTTITVTADGPEPDVQLWYVQDTNIIIAELKKLIEGTRNVKP